MYCRTVRCMNEAPIGKLLCKSDKMTDKMNKMDKMKCIDCMYSTKCINDKIKCLLDKCILKKVNK